MISQKQKKLIAGIAMTAVSMCSSLFVAGSAHAQSAVAPGTPGQLKVGMQASYPPFESYDGDKIVGSDPELMERLAKQIGMNVSFADTQFSGLILGLNAGRFDAVISAMYVTPERAAQTLVIPYAQTGSAIMATAAAGSQAKTPEDLCGLHVGIVQGTSWVPQLRAISQDYCPAHGKPVINISEFPSTADVMQAMLSNNVQVGIQTMAVAQNLSAKTQGRIVVTSTALLWPQTIGIFINKDNKALYDKLSTAFDAFRKSGEYDSYLTKYKLAPLPAGKGA